MVIEHHYFIVFFAAILNIIITKNLIVFTQGFCECNYSEPEWSLISLREKF